MQRRYPKKKNKITMWILLALLLLGMVGGVSAYLSIDSNEDSAWIFGAEDPKVLVDGTSVTVTSKGYALYLRVAVDADWQKDGVVLPEEPVGAYSLNPGWKDLGDGFYYYDSVIALTQPSDTTTLEPIKINAVTKDGCTLVVNMAAQVVQAVGMTDDGTQTAVEAAWGVTPQQITNQ